MTRYASGHHDLVTGLEQDILLTILALINVIEVKPETLRAANDDDITLLGEILKTTGIG